MFDKALTLAVFGVLVMGAATLAYGTFFDDGLAASVAGVMGMGNDDDHERARKHTPKHAPKHAWERADD